MATSHKLTCVVKTHVPDYADEALNAKARSVGCVAAEYTRDLVYMDLFGVTFGEHVANSRRSVMGFKGRATGQLGADE